MPSIIAVIFQDTKKNFRPLFLKPKKRTVGFVKHMVYIMLPSMVSKIEISTMGRSIHR